MIDFSPAIIAPRPDYKWKPGWEDVDNVACLIEMMEEATDDTKDYVYDYYSMAYWVLTFINENSWEVGP